jgi:hypothetical protein
MHFYRFHEFGTYELRSCFTYPRLRANKLNCLYRKNMIYFTINKTLITKLHTIKQSNNTLLTADAIYVSIRFTDLEHMKCKAPSHTRTWEQINLIVYSAEA